MVPNDNSVASKVTRLVERGGKRLENCIRKEMREVLKTVFGKRGKNCICKETKELYL